MTAYARQLSVAQRAYDHASPPEPDERAEEIADAMRHDAAVIRELAEALAEGMDTGQVAEVLLALMRLHNTHDHGHGWGQALEDALRLGRQYDAEHDRRMDEAIEDAIGEGE